jgi:hypothetical protein
MRPIYLISILFLIDGVVSEGKDDLGSICAGLKSIYNCKAQVKIPIGVKTIMCDKLFFKACCYIEFIFTL